MIPALDIGKVRLTVTGPNGFSFQFSVDKDAIVPTMDGINYNKLGKALREVADMLEAPPTLIKRTVA